VRSRKSACRSNIERIRLLTWVSCGTCYALYSILETQYYPGEHSYTRQIVYTSYIITKYGKPVFFVYPYTPYADGKFTTTWEVLSYPRVLLSLHYTFPGSSSIGLLLSQQSKIINVCIFYRVNLLCMRLLYTWSLRLGFNPCQTVTIPFLYTRLNKRAIAHQV
jgi:hypothetical protein